MAATPEQPPWKQPGTRYQCDAGLPPLKIWNSLTRSKTPFIPRDPGSRHITWYSCGPTVYDDAHLGHARNYVTTDILRRITRDYFQFNIKFVMNVTDVDDKIIVAARQQHLFSDYIAQHPVVDPCVVHTARQAFSTYVKEKLPLLDSDVQPSDFQKEAEKIYASILNGGALEGNKKPGDDEAKIKMHIKSGSISGKVISEALEKVINGIDAAEWTEASDITSAMESSPLASEEFYRACEDVFLVHLDSLYGSSLGGDDHSVFEKLAKHYESRFMQDMRDLNVLDPDEVVRVTQYGPEIVAFVKEIVRNDFGYVTPDGSVYFNIQAFEEAGNHYAKLEPWNRNDKQLQRDGEGALSIQTTMKRSKNDFALWKSSRPGEPSWSSPWGKGRPGWHIECSAMASAQLGNQMDIHSGGVDLAFPHHDNELAQSEAYWHETQWVNYFLHMGHLSIQGAKMSKSLKNFTTIRDALGRGGWSSRSLRTVFLLGGWREGIEITDDMIEASNSWEEKLNNFFLKVKNLSFPQESSLAKLSLSVDIQLAKNLKEAQDKVFDALCDSFDTPSAMKTISDLVTTFNSTEISDWSDAVVQRLARWITKMVNIFGLNGNTAPESSDIGWSGIDIPEHARPYVNSLSASRDALRQLAKSKGIISSEMLGDIFLGNEMPRDHEVPDRARPYVDAVDDFKRRVTSVDVNVSDSGATELLMLCDRVRDVDLFELGIYLEDQENGPTIARPVTADIIKARQRQEVQVLHKQRAKEERERKAREKMEKEKLSPFDMFKNGEFGEWDDDGLPTKDAAGNEITKNRMKKLRKECDRQKRVHDAWVARNTGGSV